jgi:hypothetical protein
LGSQQSRIEAHAIERFGLDPDALLIRVSGGGGLGLSLSGCGDFADRATPVLELPGLWSEGVSAKPTLNNTAAGIEKAFDDERARIEGFFKACLQAERGAAILSLDRALRHPSSEALISAWRARVHS